MSTVLKRVTGLASALALTIGLGGLILGQTGLAFAASPAEDFPPGKTFKSSFTVQNLDSANAANVVARFFNLGSGTEQDPGGPAADPAFCKAVADGGSGFGVKNQTAGPGGAVGFVPSCFTGLQANTKYSVVIESDRAIATVANVETDYNTDTGGLDASYTGSATGGATVFLGNLNKNFLGQNSPFYIQNTSATQDATIKVDLFKCAAATLSCDTTATVSFTDTLPKNASKEYQMTGAQIAGLPDGIATGKVTSQTAGVTLVGSVLQLSSNGASGASTFYDGGQKLYIPDINSDIFKINTPILIQNVGSANVTDVSVTYFDSQSGAQVGQVTGITVNAGSAVGRNPRNSSPENTFLQAGKFYNAVVQSATAGAKLTAVVLKNVDDGTVPPRTTAAYEGILDPGAAGRPVAYLPNVNRLLCFAGVCANSTVAATNLGAADTVVQVSYTVTGGTETFTEPSVLVGAGRSANFKPSGGSLVPADKKILAATIKSYKASTCAAGTTTPCPGTPDGSPVSGLSNRNAVTDPSTTGGVESPIGAMDGFITYDALTA